MIDSTVRHISIKNNIGLTAYLNKIIRFFLLSSHNRIPFYELSVILKLTVIIVLNEHFENFKPEVEIEPLSLEFLRVNR